jgi:hypothetical protein
VAGVRFQMAQNEVKSISNPARVTAIGGDNATEFYLFFPYMPPGSQWVFPFTYGFMYIVDSPSYAPVVVDASQTAPGAQAATATSKVAQLVAYDTDQVFNPGISTKSDPSVVPNKPATGFSTGNIQAQNGVNIIPAVIGQVIYIFNYEIFRLDSTANAADPELGILDNVSGAIAWIGHIGTGPGRVAQGDLKGSKVTIPGGAVSMHNYDTAIHSFDVNLVYSQA